MLSRSLSRIFVLVHHSVEDTRSVVCVEDWDNGWQSGDLRGLERGTEGVYMNERWKVRESEESLMTAGIGARCNSEVRLVVK